MTYAVIVFLFVAATVVACLIPACRAASVDSAAFVGILREYRLPSKFASGMLPSRIVKGRTTITALPDVPAEDPSVQIG